MSGLSLETWTSNLKSFAFTVLELLAFNAQKFGGHVTLAACPLFKKFLRGHVRSVPGNMHIKFEVRSFNRFKLVWLIGPLCTHRQTHRDTHTSNITNISTIHFIHLAEIIIDTTCGDNNRHYLWYFDVVVVSWQEGRWACEKTCCISPGKFSLEPGVILINCREENKMNGKKTESVDVLFESSFVVNLMVCLSDSLGSWCV